MNLELNIYFAKFLCSPQYLEYISYILKTDIKEYNPKVDIRFYACKDRFWDFNNLSPDEAVDAIKLRVAKLSVGLTTQLRQDFINDYLFQGRC